MPLSPFLGTGASRSSLSHTVVGMTPGAVFSNRLPIRSLSYLFLSSEFHSHPRSFSAPLSPHSKICADRVASILSDFARSSLTVRDS